MSVTGLRLGAPGIYRTSLRSTPAFVPVRLDVAGFVGVAPRGPVDLPVAVDSWGDYVRRFGGFEGPGLLPHAVAAYFAQGGDRAYVLRVSPLPRSPDPAAREARALHRIKLGAAPGAPAQEVQLAARDEGSWGDRLSIRWDFQPAQRFTSPLAGAEVTLPAGVAAPPGTLLRLRGPGLPVPGAYHWVTASAVRDDDSSARRQVAVLDPPPRGAGTVPTLLEVDVITLTVVVEDPDPAFPREERLRGLGLRREHPRFVGAVLAAESRLVTPEGAWPGELFPPDAFLSSAVSVRARRGADRWLAVEAASFVGTIDPELLPLGSDDGLGNGPGDDLPGTPDDSGSATGPDRSGEEPAVHGVDRMSLVSELGLLVVPDLLWSSTTPAAPVVLPPPAARAGFTPCVPAAPAISFPPPPPDIVLLDGGTQLDQIVHRQLRVVALAERQRRFVALLDVPPTLPVRSIARWRGRFASSYAAAYHPWLAVVRPEDPAARRTFVPPSAVAAGVIADRERRLGIPWGPANELATMAVGSAEVILDAQADDLHHLDVNVFRAERDGFRLTAGHTLSSDPDLRQLSVRRLMTMLRLVLERQGQWVAFEPHTDRLRRELKAALIQLLRGLYRGGAFAGTTEEESFFVRIDDALNPPWSQAVGRLVAEVGVAPSTPLEYLVLRISQDTDGAVTVQR